MAFILASSSPRRLALLRDIGIIPDQVIAADIDETPHPRELPRALALRLAQAKGAAIAASHPGSLILAADTVVACGRRILPKAASAADVRACLRLLAGRRHHVYTGVSLILPDSSARVRLVDSTVIFRNLSPGEIDAYAASGEGLDKAGGYAIQGGAAQYIRFISGSHSNIVGLPLFEVAQLLRGAGYHF